MGKFVRHECCPFCGSRDNRGLFDDGSYWCFGCRKYTRGPTTLASVEKLNKEDKTVVEGIINLPSDSTEMLDPKAKAWLLRYGIGWGQMRLYDMMWSDSKQMLIFPYYETTSSKKLIKRISGNGGSLICWQGRYFGDNKSYPKYITEGPKEDMLAIYGDIDSENLILVEDMVSAMKVSYMGNTCMPLLGSSIGLKRARTLSGRFSSLTIWLDPDKKKESLKQALMLRELFTEVKVIYSDKDPKELSHSTINQLVEDSK